MAISHEQMIRDLKRLRLNFISTQYVEQARLAEKEKQTYEQYLWYLIQQECECKDQNHIKALIGQAGFPLDKIVENYDWSNRTGINAKQVHRLCQGDWVRKGANVVFYGGIGVGKTHLAIGIGKHLCAQKLKVVYYSTHDLIQKLLEAKSKLELTGLFKKLDRYDLIICDELGFLPQTQEGADLFFQLISQRNERKSLLITTNLPYSDWGKVFLNPLSTQAAVDRIIHHCETFNIKGPSHRSEEAARRTKQLTDPESQITQ